MSKQTTNNRYFKKIRTKTRLEKELMAKTKNYDIPTKTKITYQFDLFSGWASTTYSQRCLYVNHTIEKLNKFGYKLSTEIKTGFIPYHILSELLKIMKKMEDNKNKQIQYINIPIYLDFIPYFGCVELDESPELFKFYIPKYSRELKMLITLLEQVVLYFINCVCGYRYQLYNYDMICKPISFITRECDGLQKKDK